MAARADSTLSTSEPKVLEAFHSSWPLSILPDVIKPYAELIRIHKPAGIMMFYFPCLYGTFLVGCLGHEINILSMAIANAKLFLLSFLMRGMLCTWNDIVDQDIDRQVARTRIRPLARGAISTTQAAIWTLIQIVLVLVNFLILPKDCFFYALPFLGLHTLYPFAKRVTHHPQLILGFAHSLGVFVSFPALGQSILLGLDTRYANAAGAFYLSAAIVFWTLLNDTIYAAQDVDDDSKAGVGSTMIYWGSAARMFLRTLALFQLLSLIAVLFVIKDATPSAGIVYSSLTCGGTALGLLTMVERVDLKEPASCAWWFNQGNVLVGYGIGSGLVGEYLVSRLQ
ncbi:para-hydroxybenzoate-polyprenyltransferase Coq2 [Usnea florida]